MKKVNFLWCAFLSVLCAFLGIVDASAFVSADSAAAAAAGAAAINADGNARAVVGQDGVAVHTTTAPNSGLNTDDIRLGSPDLIDDDVDKLVVKMFQSAVAVDQICRHLKQVKQNGMRYNFWSVDTRPIMDKTSGAFSAVNTGGTGVLSVTNGNIFDVTDVLVIPSVTGYDYNSTTQSAAGVPLHLYVQSISGNDLTVLAINGAKNANGGFNIPAIPDESIIYRLGHAASEGDVQTTPYAALPEPDEFFMQIFKTQVMETTIAAESDKKVNFSISDQSELALYNMRKEIELCYIYGCKGYFRNTATKRYVYTCAGIIQQILEKGTVIDYTIGTLTDKSLLETVVKPIFLGNSGSATRYMFAGSDIVTEIATIGSIQRQMGATQVKREFGIDWKTIQLMSWQLQLYQHPLLDEIGLSHNAFVLDLPYVRKNVFRSMKEDALELIKAGIYDGKSTVWTEISSVALKYPKCHAYIIGNDAASGSNAA